MFQTCGSDSLLFCSCLIFWWMESKSSLLMQLQVGHMSMQTWPAADTQVCESLHSSTNLLILWIKSNSQILYILFVLGQNELFINVWVFSSEDLPLYSCLFYKPGDVLGSDPETCVSLICSEDAILQNSTCGPLERCQGNGRSVGQLLVFLGRDEEQ